MKPATKITLRMRLLTTLAGWAVAFAIVYVLLLGFGKQLESLPPALNALIFTGILVPIMGNIIMPRISAFMARKLTSKQKEKL
ncbi:MAG TPA: hypothetical protein VKQ34_02995 [Candidatus Saccharimonadales bacterium]|nr:hypothetical protein [Candidatus Saccharimonadales bacterium]